MGLNPLMRRIRGNEEKLSTVPYINMPVPTHPPDSTIFNVAIAESLQPVIFHFNSTTAEHSVDITGSHNIPSEDRAPVSSTLTASVQLPCQTQAAVSAPCLL